MKKWMTVVILLIENMEWIVDETVYIFSWISNMFLYNIFYVFGGLVGN